MFAFSWKYAPHLRKTVRLPHTHKVIEFNLCLLVLSRETRKSSWVGDWMRLGQYGCRKLWESIVCAMELMKAIWFQFSFSLSPLQMHDSLTFLARYIQTRGSPLPVFGTFGIIQPDSIPIGLAKSHTTATSLAGGNLIVITLGEAVKMGEGRPARCHYLRQDRPQLLRWHPQWASTFALTVNFPWSSPLLLRSMIRPVMVGHSYKH